MSTITIALIGHSGTALHAKPVRASHNLNHYQKLRPSVSRAGGCTVLVVKGKGAKQHPRPRENVGLGTGPRRRFRIESVLT